MSVDPPGRSAKRLHVRREALRRYGLPPARFGLYGRLLQLDPEAAADWAQRLNAAMARPASTVSAGQLGAAVALHELMHALIASATSAGGRFQGAIGGAQQRLTLQPGAAALQRLLKAFGALYAPASGAAHAGRPPVLAGIEELLLLELARANPALTTLRPLFHEEALFGLEEFRAAVNALRAHGRGPADDPLAGLLELLEEPRRRAPTSLAEQLRLAVALWRPQLDAAYWQALLLALRAADQLAEEAKRAPAGPPPPPQFPPLAVAEAGPEAFTPDADWMPGVVMVAKSAPVWLAQLSQRYGDPVTTLDQIPEQALADLASDGFNALWLIGIWWRSRASRQIKRLRGQHDALGSAYSVYDYEVAPELGGEEALARLRARAGRHGLQLASDMVPNHTALDGRWVAEHPDWYVQVPTPPYPSYTFSGPELSSDPRMSLKIEDHYYDGSDAAVVFQRVASDTGEARYLFHGNDGTALPWNDTAQLDILRADVREALIQTTIAVARRFRLIRLDAAMTLARSHVRRLWHPAPGQGGAIPSRSVLALSQADFDRQMPREFWRELVDRLAVEAPGTMLLAEAFWLMEAYFVRSLGVNRVYNSAFMHMTMRQENAAHRSYLKRYLSSEPRILARFVNYMSNPDEESAADQYGDGDKAFGVTTLMCTLPGLPLFAHGQVEGLRERYGMEFSAPRLPEQPSQSHIQRHRRQIAPLLRLRHLFAGAELFRLFDFIGPGGHVIEDVFAFVNGAGAERVLVAYNNGPVHVRGRLQRSAPTAGLGAEPRSEKLVSTLGLPAGASGKEEVLFRQHPDGGQLRVPLAELAERGLELGLAPYEARVYLGVGLQAAPAAGGLGAPPPPAGRRRPQRLAVLTGRRGVAARRAAKRRRR